MSALSISVTRSPLGNINMHHMCLEYLQALRIPLVIVLANSAPRTYTTLVATFIVVHVYDTVC